MHLVKKGEFFGVYILLCKGPDHVGDVYIGFTVNPPRRIRQHNREIKGGAWKTKKNKGNWEMVLIVHGFRSKVSALQFEWAWQNPIRSKRLNHIKRKTTKEKKFDYKLKILSEMLNAGPWCRLPLTIQWLKQEYQQNFPVEKPPPMHMPIAYGPLRIAKEVEEEPADNAVDEVSKLCYFCSNEKAGTDGEKHLSCIVKTCEFVGHISCYAQHFLSSEKSNQPPKLIPVSGKCPGCKQQLLWGDLVRQRQYTLEENDNDSGDENSEDDDLLMSQQSDCGDDEEDFQ